MTFIILNSFRPFCIISLCVIFISWPFLGIYRPFLGVTYHPKYEIYQCKQFSGCFASFPFCLWYFSMINMFICLVFLLFFHITFEYWFHLVYLLCICYAVSLFWVSLLFHCLLDCQLLCCLIGIHSVWAKCIVTISVPFLSSNCFMIYFPCVAVCVI